MKFTKTNINSPKGRQPSSVDFLLEEFKMPGDSLQFDEKSAENPEGMTRQKASNIAKRLTNIGKGKQFHSFFDTTTDKVTIRLRKEGEVPTNGDDEPEEEEAQQGPRTLD